MICGLNSDNLIKENYISCFMTSNNFEKINLYVVTLYLGNQGIFSLTRDVLMQHLYN